MPINEYGTGEVSGYAIGPDADLMDADLRGADLSYSDLRGANLNYANLSGANLYQADLRGATMVGIILEDARFPFIKVDAHNFNSFHAEHYRQTAEIRLQLQRCYDTLDSIEVIEASDRTPNHHRTGILSEDYPMDPYNKDLDKAYDPYDRYWRTGNPSHGTRSRRGRR